MKFSVIIPVYNKANTIAESLQSILAQTETDYEIIVVNDGSSDHLHDVLRDFPTVQVIDQPNGGVSVARNTGIHAAKGDYVCFLDADDLWLPSHLEEMSILINQFPAADMFVTSHITTTTDGKTFHSSQSIVDLEHRFISDNLFALLNSRAYNIIHTNSICIRKSTLEANHIYFEAGEKIGEDTDVWYRVALCSSVAISKIETTAYRKENSTATQNGSNTFNWIFARRWETIKSSNYPEERKIECRKLIERQKMTCSRDYLLLKDREKARQVLKDIQYRNKRYYLSLILTILPYSMSKWLITHR